MYAYIYVYVSVCAYYIYFIHSSIGGHLSYFHLLATENETEEIPKTYHFLLFFWLLYLTAKDKHSVQLGLVTQSCLILCDPMNHSTSGFPVHHQLLEFTQTHVH